MTRDRHKARGRSRRIAIAGIALVTAGGGFALMSNGPASADTTPGEVSVQCRFSLFEDENLGGQEANTRLDTFAQRLPITLDDNGGVVRTSNIYDLDVGNVSVRPSSMFVTCALNSNLSERYVVAASVARLYKPPSGPADGCGSGKGTIDDYSEVSVGSEATTEFTLYENSFPRDFPGCDDNLGRISLKLEVLG